VNEEYDQEVVRHFQEAELSFPGEICGEESLPGQLVKTRKSDETIRLLFQCQHDDGFLLGIKNSIGFTSRRPVEMIRLALAASGTDPVKAHVSITSPEKLESPHLAPLKDFLGPLLPDDKSREFKAKGEYLSKVACVFDICEQFLFFLVDYLLLTSVSFSLFFFLFLMQRGPRCRPSGTWWPRLPT